MSHTIGVDLGGSTLRVALVNADGEMAQSERVVLEARDPQAVLTALKNVVETLGADADGAPVGIGLAAQLLINQGIVTVAPNLGWRDVPFGQLASVELGRPVRLVNDLNAITVGEAQCGAGQGAKDVVCVFLGTGLGMGAVSGGLIVEGAEGLATELGHVKVASPEYGRECGCGERGCAEAYTSGFHLPDLFVAKVEAGVASPMFNTLRGDKSKINAERIEAGAKEGDEAAEEMWHDVAEHLGCVIGNAITVFNPAVLVLGGGVLSRAPSLYDLAVQRINAFAARSALKNLSIRSSALGDRAGMVGAGILAQSLVG